MSKKLSFWILVILALIGLCLGEGQATAIIVSALVRLLK